MFLEKIKVIKEAENSAAKLRQDVQTKIKLMLAKSHEDGAKSVEDAENAAVAQTVKLMEKADEKAHEITEAAKSDSKVDSLAKKLEAESSIAEAVKYIIGEIMTEWKS